MRIRNKRGSESRDHHKEIPDEVGIRPGASHPLFASANTCGSRRHHRDSGGGRADRASAPAHHSPAAATRRNSAAPRDPRSAAASAATRRNQADHDRWAPLAAAATQSDH